MKRIPLALVLAAIVAAAAAAQAPPARVLVVNLADRAVDVRLGEETAPALRLDGLAPRGVTPLLSAPSGEHVLAFRPRGAAEWVVLRERLDEATLGGPLRHALPPGTTAAILVSTSDGLLSASFQPLDVPAGKGPKVLVTSTFMGPPRSAILAGAPDAPEAVTVEGIVQYGIAGPIELPAAGPRSVFFQFPAFFDTLTHFLPDARDPARPAVFDFRDGGFYVVVLDKFTDQAAVAWLAPAGAPGPASPPPSQAPARPATPPAAGAQTLKSVPPSWNGDWMEENRPGRRALAVHDGRIFLVAGSSETETFPGTASRLYTFTYAEREVATLMGGKPYERYVLSPDGNRITHTIEGRVTVYVRMPKR